MIVKDEEAFLGQAIESAKGWADELIVVDTGSTDRTPEIAATHGAQVHHLEWSGFSDARNHSIDLASGRWILILDVGNRRERNP